MPRNELLGLALGILLVSGCADASREVPVPAEYPVRSDYLVVAPPKAAVTHLYDIGFPPLYSLNLPDGVKDDDQKAFAKELETKNILRCSSVAGDDRERFRTTLNKFFGTPIQPVIDTGSPEQKTLVAELKLDPETLAHGAALFRKNCLQCHGLPGDGNGPGGRFMFPPPRDYRQGLFKFITTEPAQEGTKPSRQDLFNTIWRGLPGSGMTSWSGMAPSDVEALVSHVIYLAIRGEAEYQTMKITIRAGLEGEEIETEIKNQANRIIKLWHDSQPRRIVPSPNPYLTDDQQLEAASNGYKIFMDGQQGACTTCHVNFGKNSPYQYDAWGTMVKPRNLTAGIFRVGNGPDVLYQRIYGGIQGSLMPSHAHLMPKPGEKGHRIWDLVYFVRSISNQELRAKLKEKFQIDLD